MGKFSKIRVQQPEGRAADPTPPKEWTRDRSINKENWTDAEEQFLIDHCRRYRAPVLARFLHRTPAAIAARLFLLQERGKLLKRGRGIL